MILMKGQATESGKDQVLIQDQGQVTIIETNISKIDDFMLQMIAYIACDMALFDFSMLRRQ